MPVTSPSGPVVAVVSAFHPTVEIIQRLLETQKQVDAIIVVDDGSGPDSEKTLTAIEIAGFTVLRQATNSGIAAALNRGIAHARSQFYATWILTLDQDSTLAPGYVKRCLEEIQKPRPAGSKVAVVCAEAMNGRRVPFQFGPRSHVDPYDPMQSGFLISCKTFDRLGYFDESLFIDGVDTEFVLRSRSLGWLVTCAPGTDLQHSLGTQVTKSLVGQKTLRIDSRESFSYHPPFRIYYIVRNRLMVLAKYLVRQPVWFLRRAFDDVILVGRNLIFGPAKGKTLMAIGYGTIDAALGRSGRIPSQLLQRLGDQP